MKHEIIIRNYALADRIQGTVAIQYSALLEYFSRSGRRAIPMPRQIKYSNAEVLYIHLVIDLHIL